MSKHDDALYLGHMIEYSRRAHAKIVGVSAGEFDGDEDLQVIVAHLIQIVGEAATRVSRETRNAHPEVPWERITGLRHRLVHDYGNINYSTLWEVAANDLPPLIAALEKFTPPEPPSV